MMTIFILVSFILITGVIVNSAWFKGIWGEYKVNSLIESKLDKKSYKLLKDVLLPTEDGSTQVDHIIVSRFGIFVIETKNMSNWIFTNNSARWTQVIFKKKYSFQNPQKQNYKHIKTLEKILGDAEKFLFNIVVFAGDCQFKTDTPKGVIKINSLISHIKSYQEQVIDNIKIREYINKINDVKLESTIKNRMNHIRHVENIVSGSTKDIWIFDRIIKLFAYKFISSLIFILIFFSFFHFVSKQITKTFNSIVETNLKQQDINRNKQNNLTKNYNESTQPVYVRSETKPIEITMMESKIVKQKASNTNKRIIYSWKNENGQRAFSNVGFPEDGNYSDGKMEWY